MSFPVDWLGYLGIAIMLLWLSLLSRRLGSVTHAKPQFIGLWVASFLVASGAVARFVNAWRGTEVNHSLLWVLVYHGLPALGLTIGVIFAWRYWSWLLAERS